MITCHGCGCAISGAIYVGPGQVPYCSAGCYRKLMLAGIPMSYNNDQLKHVEAEVRAAAFSSEKLGEIITSLNSATRAALEARIAERERALVEECGRLRAQVEKLQAFKEYVHGRLDRAGVPRDPESSHRSQGCRIGGRLDWTLRAAGLQQPEIEP